MLTDRKGGRPAHKKSGPYANGGSPKSWRTIMIQVMLQSVDMYFAYVEYVVLTMPASAPPAEGNHERLRHRSRALLVRRKAPRPPSPEYLREQLGLSYSVDTAQPEDNATISIKEHNAKRSPQIS